MILDAVWNIVQIQDQKAGLEVSLQKICFALKSNNLMHLLVVVHLQN